MTQIEDLVRQALAETPTVSPTTDPLAGLDRRVRRARHRLAAGAGAAAAAVVAAVVVPLAVLGGNGAPNSVSVARTPSPAPLASGTTALWTDNATSVTSGSDGRRWVLYSDGGQDYVTQLAGGAGEPTAVQSPADYVVAGDTVWTVGTDRAAGTVRVSALDAGGDVLTLQPFTGVVEAPPVVVGDALYVLAADNAATRVRRFDLRSGGIDQSPPLEIDGASEIAATSKGHIWVLAGQRITEVTATKSGLSTGTAVDWGGDIFGPTRTDTGGDSLWAYDGDRLIGLTPQNLLAGTSVAEGWRLSVPGHPTAAAESAKGDVYVATESGLLHYTKQDVQDSCCPHPATLSGVHASALSIDPAGGVDYVDSTGRVIRWDPAVSGAR